jgi:hypothetical protein
VARAGSTAAGAVACLLSLACGSNEPKTPFGPSDPAGSFFAPEHVLQVTVEMSPQDWDAMRRQTRDWWDVAAASNKQCLLQPFAKPFGWFEANVTVDGLRRERVAVRKKGFLGSLNDERPALKIRFDANIPGQTLYGLSRLTLNNSVQDPSWLRQCVAYQVFGKAGVPVPWCNFAHVTANGRDLGLYVNVESVDRRWVRRNFERDGGELWEGEWSDFDTTFINTFEKKGDVDNDDQRGVDRSSLDTVRAAAAADLPWSRAKADLSKAIDLDEFLRFWAAEKVLEHWDGYSNNLNNFYVYRDPGQDDRFVFAPSGTDQITVPDPFSTLKPPVSVYALGAISNRLYAETEGRQLYVKALESVLGTAFDETELVSAIDRMQSVITPVLSGMGAETVRTQAEAAAALRTWIAGRRAVLMADLGNGPPEWSQPRKNAFCVDLAGDLEGVFATSFGTNKAPDIFVVGNGAVAGVYRKVTLSVRRVGSQAGYDRNAQVDPWPVIDITAEGTDGTSYNIWIGVNPQQFRDGASGPFDSTFAWGGVGLWNPRTWQWTYLGGFVGGKVELERASLADGAPVRGRFEARVIQW